jgi:adenine-specific DNA-methyltransferase
MAATERDQRGPKPADASRSKDGVPRLAWASKPTTIERVALPFQVIETINESRATREAQRGSLFAGQAAGADGGWRNKLIWGDNKLVAASLLNDFAGRVNLVYIDPPFDTGTDFSFRVRVGDEQVTKQPSIIEEHAYSDTWGAGRSSYLRMMYERVVLIWELLAEDGSFYLHCAPSVSHYLKVICDEVFGADNFRNEIIWRRTGAHGRAMRWGPIHDSLLYYSKSEKCVWNRVFEAYDESYVEDFYRFEDEHGRYRLVTLDGPGMRQGSSGQPWRGIDPTRVGRHWEVPPDRALPPWFEHPVGYPEMSVQERLDVLDAAGLIYWPTRGEKPQHKRYLDAAEGNPIQDIISDIRPVSSQASERVGYETQKPVELLDRVIRASSNEGDLVCDLFCGSGTTAVAAEQLGRRWILADLGRFAIHTTRKRLLSVADCSPFEILNLGAYERQHWQQATTGPEIAAYVNFVLALYNAEPIEGYEQLHGKKAERLVHVGAVDAPVTIDEIEAVLDELATNDLAALDVLGWEWEMGLHDVVGEVARRRGLDVRCRQIPREVMKAELDDEVRFFELAFLDLQVDREGRSVRVQLRDFVIPSDELIPDAVRERITQWSDYIDYWSVDFNFRDDTFHNEWQAYRTREEPALSVESDLHDYGEPGRYAIVVKVIDIFGNDTTKLAEVVVK